MEPRMYKAPAPGELVKVKSTTLFRKRMVSGPASQNGPWEEICSWNPTPFPVSFEAVLVADPEWLLVREKGCGTHKSTLMSEVLTPYGPAYTRPGNLSRVTD